MEISGDLDEKKALARERMAKARAAKKAKVKPSPEPHNGNGTLQEPSVELDRLYEMLGALTVDYLNKNFDERRLRELCEFMSLTLDRCSKRLQILESTRTAIHCDHCKKPLPGGRHVGEIVVRDELTNELKALRACSESCYREVSRVANERRQRNQGSIRGSVAI